VQASDCSLTLFPCIQELQKQYAPIPLKNGEEIDFTPRVQSLHDNSLVKKEAAKAKSAKLMKTAESKQAVYSQIRKQAYDFRDKAKKEEEPEPETYTKGMKVTIVGLVKAAKYNDKVAEVTDVVKDGRYPVRIVDSKKNLNVKRANLRLYRPVVCKEFVSLNLEQGFRCTPELLFRALTDQDTVSKYQQSEAKIDVKTGGKFSLFGGSIHGHFVEVNAPAKLIKKWRFREWPDDHFSTVEINITSPEYGITVLKLKQTSIPIHDKFRNRDVPQKVKKGWTDFFWARIQKFMGFAKVGKKEYNRKKKKRKESESSSSDDG
jgi:uncharacterized protein YndB with AHSA1/START domain